MKRRYTFALEPDDHKTLKETAAKRGISMSELLAELVAGLHNSSPAPQQKLHNKPPKPEPKPKADIHTPEAKVCKKCKHENPPHLTACQNCGFFF